MAEKAIWQGDLQSPEVTVEWQIFSCVISPINFYFSHRPICVTAMGKALRVGSMVAKIQLKLTHWPFVDQRVYCFFFRGSLR
jgi:hypothetical protein